MAVFKCKMCGAALERQNNETVLSCDYCGTTQTIPKTSDDSIANLFNRANNLRLKCEFDKAAQIYEKIIEQDDSEAEAHWGIVLCKYGIEYVEDPATNKRVPTCHRTLFEAITTDADYQAAIDYSDFAQQDVYQAEAKAIDKIQRDILAVVRNEKPFDVFICYKETDASGARTRDSVIANEIYYQLTNEGYKVFYAAITLEDKLGQEYEPYIFAALNSAKVMLVVGTQPEYFSAVWVKNEWSRFLQLMKKDRTRLLIPCYRDIDPYDLPEEFAHLQAQDMGKIGFINDLVRGIQKVVKKDDPKSRVETHTEVRTVTVQNAMDNANIAAYLRRVEIFLGDSDWSSANEYCEKVLDMDPENAEAYLGKLMAELHVKSKDKLSEGSPFENNKNYRNALRFADSKLSVELKKYAAENTDWNKRKEIYDRAVENMDLDGPGDFYIELANAFKSISGFLDADAKAKECLELDAIAKREAMEAQWKAAQQREKERLYEIEVEKKLKEKQEKEIQDTLYIYNKHKMLKRVALPLFIFSCFGIVIFTLLLAKQFYVEISSVKAAFLIAGALLGLPMIFTLLALKNPEKGRMRLAKTANIWSICILSYVGLAAILSLSLGEYEGVVVNAPSVLLGLSILIFATWRRKVGKAIFKKTGKKQ